jgi:hypothetical protein
MWAAGCLNGNFASLYVDENSTPLWRATAALFSEPALAITAGLSIMLAGALIIQRASYNFIIIREKTSQPFFLYILFYSSCINQLPLSPAAIALIFFISATYQLLSSYHNEISICNAYNAALLIGLGSLFWIPLLWMTPVIWIGMYRLQSFSRRTFSASVAGIATVYWILLGYCMLTGDFSYFSSDLSQLFRIDILSWLTIGKTAVLNMILILVFIIIGLLGIHIHEYDDSLRTRQYLSFLSMLNISTFLLYIIFGTKTEGYVIVLCAPLAILFAHFLSTGRWRGKRLILYLCIIFLLLVTAITYLPNLMPEELMQYIM